ncbi:MAG: response regulator [Treponema sp.]|jgi:CheY-like chemotaxis protein|nr:response regulator [Treponema sp.]
MSEPKKNSILIVDDETSNIMVLTHILSHKYTIYAVKNGKNAIAAAEKHLPDIILLDVLMPDMDGYTVITELKKTDKTKNIPVIFITGLTDTGDEEKGIALGACDYIKKPFSSSIVEEKVENQIRLLNEKNV